MMSQSSPLPQSAAEKANALTEFVRDLQDVAWQARLFRGAQLEDSLLSDVLAPLPRVRPPRLAVGIGDDAAVLIPSGRPVLLASDLCVEHRHFELHLSPAEDIGYKALARPMSDIVAMGGVSVAVTLSVAVPEAWSYEKCQNFLRDFFRGAHNLARMENVDIAGGDLTRTRGPLCIDVTAYGELPAQGSPWLRSQAQVGDLIFVSGSLGRGLRGLHLLEQLYREQPDQAPHFNLSNLKPEHQNAIEHYRRPHPRTDLQRAMSASKITPRACMDISDGILRDLHRMAQASGVQITVDATKIHRHPAVADLSEKEIFRHKQAGDEYELLFAIAPDQAQEHIATLSEWHVRPIGVVTDSREIGLRVHRPAGHIEEGHDPFEDLENLRQLWDRSADLAEIPSQLGRRWLKFLSR